MNISIFAGAGIMHLAGTVRISGGCRGRRRGYIGGDSIAVLGDVIRDSDLKAKGIIIYAGQDFVWSRSR